MKPSEKAKRVVGAGGVEGFVKATLSDGGQFMVGAFWPQNDTAGTLFVGLVAEDGEKFSVREGEIESYEVTQKGASDV